MNIGQRYLVTTNDWFFAPDGENYKAVFGTVHGVEDAESVLGIRTNARSTNWYLRIGDTVVAGCQVFYAVRCDQFDPAPQKRELEHEGKVMLGQAVTTRIYDADKSGLVAGEN